MLHPVQVQNILLTPLVWGNQHFQPYLCQQVHNKGGVKRGGKKSDITYLPDLLACIICNRQKFVAGWRFYWTAEYTYSWLALLDTPRSDWLCQHHDLALSAMTEMFCLAAMHQKHSFQTDFTRPDPLVTVDGRHGAGSPTGGGCCIKFVIYLTGIFMQQFQSRHFYAAIPEVPSKNLSWLGAHNGIMPDTQTSQVVFFSSLNVQGWQDKTTITDI